MFDVAEEGWYNNALEIWINMTNLAIVACAFGGTKILGGLGALYAPEPTRRMLQAFPRHEVAGWVLTAINLFWASWLLLNTTPFSQFRQIEPLVYIGTPVVFFAVVVYLDELLAVRAFGGLLLLVANPVLAAARFHPTSWSLLMSGLAYIWVVCGMLFVVSPHLFRKTVQLWIGDGDRFRFGSLLGVLVGGGLVFLGLAVY